MKGEFEIIKVVDNKDQIDWLYGGGEYFIDDDDIEMLKAGKIINFSVNQEYGCALIYNPKKEPKRMSNKDFINHSMDWRCKE